MSNLRTGTKTCFVVQKHEAKRAGLHYDFRFAEDGAAPSWALPKGFPEDEKQIRLAIETELHSIDYMSWEGEIEEGYGRGTVEIWASGDMIIYQRELDKVKFEILEGKLRGHWRLWRRDGNQWLLRKVKAK